MTALTALAFVIAGLALTAAPDSRARVLGAALAGVGMVLAARRWEAARVDHDRRAGAPDIGARPVAVGLVDQGANRGH